MALKTFKPYTKSTRGTILASREGLWKGKPFKPFPFNEIAFITEFLSKNYTYFNFNNIIKIMKMS